MRTRLLSAVLTATVLTAAVLTAAPALARPTRAPERRAHSATAGYVNPFAGGGWEPARTDMGVDWLPVRPVPVQAIGDALILGSDWKAPWPGGHIIWYQLLDGSHAGDVIYVAEHLRDLVRAGTRVRAGAQIAVALPGYPWTEWGWADQYGSPLAYPCYHEGEQTRSGRRMARFMEELGARTYDDPGPGPDTPLGGPLC